MADFAVVITVTPDSSASTGFDWTYSVNGGPVRPLSGTDPLFTVPLNADPGITITLEPGHPGDTCVFSSPAVEITPSSNPFQNVSQVDSSTLSFTDDNDSPPTFNTTYHLKLFVKYNGGSVASPDPTIVNAGVDGQPGPDGDTAK